MATDGLRFILVFDANNSYFLDAAGEGRLDGAVNSVFIRAAEAAIRSINTERVGVPFVDVSKIRDGWGNTVGTLKVCYGSVNLSGNDG